MAAPNSTRFVVLCLARTGSTHLGALLDSHPDIRCYGEIVNPTHPGAAPDGWLGDLPDADVPAGVDALLAGAGTPVCGFKLPLNSIRERPVVATWLEDRPDVRVLRLKRRNALALLLSRRMLRATLVSQSVYGSYGDTTVRIEPPECLRALERIESEDAELDEIAAAHERIELTYELLDDASEMARAQRFLGVEPAPLASRYERLRRRSLAETIENWDELAGALAGTRFAPMLEG